MHAHGLFVPALSHSQLCLQRRLIDVFELVLAQLDDIPMLHQVFLDRFAINNGTVGAIQILEKGIISQHHDRGMLTADGEIVDVDVIARSATNRRPLFFQRNLAEEGAIE